MERIKPLFDTATRNGSPQTQVHLQGVLSALGTKNMRRMEGRLSGAKQEHLQQFVDDGAWSSSGLWSSLGRRANEHLGRQVRSMLLIEEGSHAKKDAKSAGVARPYHGWLGKPDDRQAGVYAAPAPGPWVTSMGGRLGPPEDWVEDSPRCLAAGIPTEEIRLRTKLELAQELVQEASTQAEHHLLSVRDEVQLMGWYFMPHLSLEELLEIVRQRHRLRKQVMQAATKRAKKQSKDATK